MKKNSTKTIILSSLCAIALMLVISLLAYPKEKPASLESNDTSDSKEEDFNYRSIAYVTVPASENWRWIGTDGPKDNDAVSNVDTRYVTHINFAFGMIQSYQFEEDKEGCPKKDGLIVSQEAYKNPADNQYHYKATLQGWIEEMNATVDGREYLKALCDLKQQKPDLNILLSIGGWNSDGFCYMARTPEGRSEFTESCIQLIKDYGLDGIDIDWEYPSNGGWGEVASCDHCVDDGLTLLQEMRSAFNQAFPKEHKLLTIASGGSLPWIDSKTLDALDYINVMCYDYSPGNGQSQAGMDYVTSAMNDHVEKIGDIPENRKKLNLGIPFYNEGGPYLVPYYKGWDGYVDASPEITRDKMNWVKENGFGGGFYWAYSMDVFEQDVTDSKDPQIKVLQRTLYETLHSDGK